MLTLRNHSDNYKEDINEVFMGVELHCSCEPPGDQCDIEKDYCATYGKCFSAAVINEDGSEYRSLGCMGQDDQSSTLTCRTPSSQYLTILCCDTGPFCNLHLSPSFVTLSVPVKHQSLLESRGHLLLAVILSCVLIILVVIPLTLYLLHVFHKRRIILTLARYCGQSYYSGDNLITASAEDSKLHSVCCEESSVSSGTGSGLPLLVQRTVASHVTLTDRIGQGRFGEVWRGLYQGEYVAVKIFSTRNESSWAWESRIYNTSLLRHDNILGFLASDMTSRNSCTQLWLIMHYHDRGSLYDYLRCNIVSRGTLVTFARSIAAGLVHLHTEIMGVEGKPAIAHRDIKSKNVLVKRDGQCCIGDLGLAALYSRGRNAVSMVADSNLRVGTVRYMAPEVLSETLAVTEFESYRRADVYAFGLVLWEILRRCPVGDTAEEYCPPYDDLVPNDPTLEEMRKVVCEDQRRPNISSSWSTDLVTQLACDVMRECWHQRPGARLSMLRVKKTFDRLAKTFHSCQRTKDEGP